MRLRATRPTLLYYSRITKTMLDLFGYKRRQTSVARIGDTPLGSDYPIRIQSMASVSTMDTEASIGQAVRIIDAGADYVRFTAQGVREAANLAHIRAGLTALGYPTPLVADIHFNPKAADEALLHVEKVRINPGNFVESKADDTLTEEEAFDKGHRAVVERFGAFVQEAAHLGRAIRIGVNHGSLSERMLRRYGDTAEGMVESCMEFLDVCRAQQFDDVVISMKASNTLVMTAAVRMLVERMDAAGIAFPLHLGVTEAGDGEDGRIKSAVGIGSLLADGIGDTIRVSLSEDPEYEVPVARKLVAYIERRSNHPAIILPHPEQYDRNRLQRQETVAVGSLIGGKHTPIVLSDRSKGGTDFDADLQPDIILRSDGNYYQGENLLAEIHFLPLRLSDLTEERLQTLKTTPDTVLIIEAAGINPVAEWRAASLLMEQTGCNCPVILHRRYDATELEDVQLQAAADMGTLLLEGRGNGLMITADRQPAADVDRLAFGILQATRLRMSRTEYISCPGCGRTLYNLQETVARIKAATAHLKELKIGIMGCIVNGPGEMADADYGYVGAGPGRIDLYKQKVCVRRGIPQEEAVQQLVDLIKENGDWKER